MEKNSILLRYRFDDVPQLQRHLHVIENRTIFFIRDPGLTLTSSARVVLEVCFTSNEQQSVLRGQVLGLVEGQGAWLDFPDSRFVKKASGDGLAARKQRRLPADLLVEARHVRGANLCRMLDVSLNGCRLTGLAGAVLHEDLELRLLQPPPDVSAAIGRAQVLRVIGNDVACRFLRTTSEARVAVAKLFQSVHAGWGRAIEVRHPQLCCACGRVLEPALPHLKSNRG